MLDPLPDKLHKNAPGMDETSLELLKNTSRIIVTAMGGGIVLWLLLEGSIHSDRVADIFPVGLFFGGLCFLVIYLLERQIILSQVIWQVGIFIGITLLLYVYQRPDLVYLYSLLPLMAVIMFGWKMALIAAVGGYGLLFLVVQLGVITTLTEDYLPGVLLGMSLAGFIGWAGMRSMLTQVEWSFSAYQQAAIKVREAQEQRLELVQTQEDLLQANRELARLSDRLRLMTSAAEEARKVKEEFVANVSHELRTPLNMIIGFSEVILRSPRAYGTKLPETLLADIAAIQRNSQHLVGLVNDVLALSQADTGHLILMRDWCILQDIVREAVEAVRVFYESKKLYLVTDLPDDPLSIFCDGLRIREVILNLLSNAGRFTDKGGVRVRVWVNDGYACVSVTDTGPGIAEEDQERIFEPFQQLDSSIRKKNTGTGLGLTISKRFIEMHDGKMWLESVPLQGTTFYFSLPVQPKIESSVPVTKAVRWISPYQQVDTWRTRRSLAPSPDLVPRLVLLEDEDRLRQLFSRSLKGMEIISTRLPGEALAELEKSPAAALVVNIQNTQAMTEKYGLLGELPFNAPLVTCWLPGKEEAARKLGVVDYLIKPVTRDCLAAAMKKFSEKVKTILIVDDQAEAIQLMARMLGAEGHSYKILRAMNGVEALEIMRSRKPDAVLLDLIMPDMDGYQVLQEKERDPSLSEIAVIVVSSLDPGGGAIVANSLTINRSNGISAQELTGCIQAVSHILSPFSRQGNFSGDSGVSPKPDQEQIKSAPA